MRLRDGLLIREAFQQEYIRYQLTELELSLIMLCVTRLE